MDRLLSSKRVCELLDISRTTLWRAVKDGRLPPPRKILVNGDNRWSESEIDEAVHSLPVASAYRNSGYFDSKPQAA